MSRLLTRHSDEKRVDELPMLVERNPDTAVHFEKIKDYDLLSETARK